MGNWRGLFNKDNLKLVWAKISYHSNEASFKLGLIMTVSFVALYIVVNLFKTKSSKRIKK